MHLDHIRNRSAPSFALGTPMPAAAVRPLIVSLVLGLLAGGAPDQGVAAAGTGRDAISLDRALAATLRPSSPRAAEAFLRSLPEPRSVRRRLLPNLQNPSRKDTLRTLQFEGIAITTYRVSATGARFPVAVSVTSERFRTAKGLRVGLGLGEVKAILGNPSAQASGTWRYQVLRPMGTAPYELRVYFAHGRVTRLRWTAYLD